MTREEQIKTITQNNLNDIISICNPSDEYIKGYTHGFKEGAEWADNHPNWHKVDEELPPPISDVSPFSNDVIVTDGVLICNGYYNYTSKSWSAFGDIDSDEVTHWMYLPDFPQKID